MSNPWNDRWLEVAKDNFDQAIAEGNIALAKDIIADTIDAGFTPEARQMVKQLRADNYQQDK